jgi:hypothetical protein
LVAVDFVDEGEVVAQDGALKGREGVTIFKQMNDES